MEEFNFDDEIDEGSGSFTDLRETGVSDVMLKRVTWSKTRNGAIQLQITVNAGGEYDDTFYQGNIKNINGEQGFEVARLLNPLKLFTGATGLSTSEESISTGKGTTIVNVFDQFVPTKIKIAHQKTWNDWGDGRWEKKIANVFSEDGRTASEVKAGTEAKQIDYYLGDKFVDKGPKGGTKPKAVEPTNQIDITDEEVPF